jgi:hypothetical protein
VFGGKQERPLGAAGERDERGTVGPRGVEHGQGIGGELLLAVGVRVLRAV